MARRWPPTWWQILAVATLLGISSAFQAHRLVAIESGDASLRIPLVLLNLTYWYAPALLTPLTIRLARRFRLGGEMWTRALAVHVSAAVLFALVSIAILILGRMVLYPKWAAMMAQDPLSYIERNYFMNLDWALMTYAAIVGLSHGVDYYREARAREKRAAQLETKLVEAQLKTLQGQLHPHFLFNTLHAISALIHRDADDADRMVSRLSDLLRLTLEHDGTQEVSLKEELEFLQKYLEIEQIRFQDRLTVKFAVQPQVLDARVPTLILQPVVENAIRHGIGPLTGGGLVEVSARAEGETLLLQVRDTGAGLSEDALTALQKGIGLSNTRARLECLYGSRQRFEFSNVHGGLTVRIVIPLRIESAPAVDVKHTPRVA
jgi:signal transduction histidine kinase